MMLGMIGHIPRQHPHDPVGERGPRVLQHVSDRRAQTMFGQKVEPQKRLAHQEWDDPHPQKQRGDQELIAASV